MSVKSSSRRMQLLCLAIVALLGAQAAGTQVRPPNGPPRHVVIITLGYSSMFLAGILAVGKLSDLCGKCGAVRRGVEGVLAHCHKGQRSKADGGAFGA